MLLSRPLGAAALLCVILLGLVPNCLRGDTILLHGLIDAPGNPESIAAAYETQFQGSLAVESGSSIAGLESRLIGAKTAVTGTLQVCLLPSGFGNGPCDPAYVSFAVMSLNVAGLDIYTVVRGNIQSVATDAVAPEPKALGIVGCCSLLLFTLANRFRARRQMRIQPLTFR